MSLPEPFASAGCRCDICPFAIGGRPGNFLLPADFVNPRGVMVLGSGPTRDDIKQGEALSGHMGREVRSALDEAGIRRESIQVLHAYVCTAKEPKRDREEKAATLACHGLLWQSLFKVDTSTPVMLSGKWALLAVNGKQEGVFNSRGFVDASWVIKRKEESSAK